VPEQRPRFASLRVLRVAWGLALFLAGGPPATAEVFGDIEVREVPGLPAAAQHGLLEHRFRVLNRALDRPHQVRLTFPSGSGAYGMPWAEATLSAAVAAGSEVELRLYTHRGHAYLPLLRVEIDGREAKTSPMTVNAPIGGSPGGSCFLLHSPVLPLAAFPEAAVKRCNPVSADQGVKDWSDHWLAYTGFEGVALRAEELASAPAGVRRALADYLLSGGLLLVLGVASEDLAALDLPLRWGVSHRSAALVRHDVGLGALFLTPARLPSDLPEAELDTLFLDGENASTPWRQMPDALGAERHFPVSRRAGDKGRPERGLFLLLAIFALAVGPVAMLWLRRRGRPLWILIVVPLAAVVTCGILIAALLLLEGVAPRQRVDATTFLDQTAQRAVTVSRMAFYAPFPPEALAFETETQVEPFYFPRFGGSQLQRVTDWSHGQSLGAGWLPPRVPLHLMVRRVEDRRERLTVEWRDRDGMADPTADTAPVRVVNGLGAAVERLWLVTPQGRLLEGRDIEAGAAAVLRPEAASTGSTAPPGLPARELWRLYNSQWLDLPDELAAKAPGIVAPGHYLAVLRAAPFVESPLGAKGEEGEEGDARIRAVVYGRFWDGEVP
jgi:hypothetical protein